MDNGITELVDGGKENQHKRIPDNMNKNNEHPELGETTICSAEAQYIDIR